MRDIEPYNNDQSPFEAIKEIIPETGEEFWSARRLQPLMAYKRWEDFDKIINRAYKSAENSGHPAYQAFSATTETATGGRRRADYNLSRFAAYLVAMNGDPNKPEVAAAQAYFAIMTREAEVSRSKSALELLRDQIDVAIAHERRIAVQEQRTGVLEAKVSGIEGEYDWFTALGYAKLNGHKTDRTSLSAVGKMATRLMRQQGEEPHKRQDATFGEINIYPVDILREAFLRSQSNR